MSSPKFGSPSFVCPHCKANSSQSWMRAEGLDHHLRGADGITPEELQSFVRQLLNDPAKVAPRVGSQITGGTEVRHNIAEMSFSECFSCKLISIWVGPALAWPRVRVRHIPNTDLPAEVRKDFLEADAVYMASPRAAAALLRLAVQRLCIDCTGENNLNSAIAKMASSGLPKQIEQALDVVRVIGNNAVHPGSLDEVDDAATVSTLFTLVNLVAEHLITQPRQLGEMYGKLPQGARDAISKRSV